MPDSRINFAGIKRENANRITSLPCSIWMVVPLLLFESFTKPSNVFFLIVALLQQIPGASPMGRGTTVISLGIFVSFSIITSTMKMFKQKKKDDSENDRIVQVWSHHGAWESVAAKHLACGNVIKVSDGEVLPADSIAFYTADYSANFYLNTAALDGEQVPKCKLCLFDNDLADLSLGYFKEQAGERWKIVGMSENVATKSHLAERGCVLSCSSGFLVALVVRSGENCTLRQNIGRIHSKPAKTDNEILKYIFVFTVSMIGLFVVNCAVFSGIPTSFRRRFMVFSAHVRRNDVWFACISFFIMFSISIPLSVYYLLELIREGQAYFIRNDLQLWSNDSNGRGPIVNCSRLNSELGTVSTLVLDKTGTITENCMIFHSISSHLPANERQMLVDAICTCHSVSLFREKSGKIGMSNFLIDEYAILKEFLHEIESFDSNMLQLKYSRQFQILHREEFVSEKRKSSVIVALGNEIFLFVKGSDSVMFAKTESYNKSFAEELDAKALSLGLRSLVYCGKKLDSREYLAWKGSHARHSTTSLETRMKLLGAAFLTDKLQPKTKETVQELRNAKIKLALASGDKREVCVGIAKMIGMLSTEEIKEFSFAQPPPESCAISLDGCVLDSMSLENREILGNALARALPYGIVAYRMKPGNKRVFVQLLQEFAPSESVAAVGDGSNDIGMLQEASLAIGIFGKESNDSVLSSEYSINSFSHLKRLILYHGNLNRERINSFIAACFYKSFVICFCHLFLQFLSAFGSFAPFDAIVYEFHNIGWTIFAAIVVGLFDQKPTGKIHCTSAYRIRQFKRRFWLSTCEAFWHSCCIIIIPWLFYCSSSLNALTMHENVRIFSTVAYTSLLVIVNGKILFINSHFIALPNFLAFCIPLCTWGLYLGKKREFEWLALCSSESFFLILLIVVSSGVWSVICRSIQESY